jgi:flagellar biosynthesis protein FlhG
MKVISVTGGKGGIGKTTISVNLAVSFAKSGKKVLIFDADLGLANVDVLFGLKPTKTINDYITGQCSLSDVCMTGPYGIKIIPSASGIQKLADLTPEQSIEIIRSFSMLTDDIDIMLIDMASGISRQTIDFTHAAQNILLVVCNDPSSMMDSYAVIKILHQQHAREKFGIVVNKVKNLKEGYSVFLQFQETVMRFMNIGVEYLGYIPNDDYIAMAARENVAVVDKFPISPSSIALNDLSRGIYGWVDETKVSGGIQYFFEQLVTTSESKTGELCKA